MAETLITVKLTDKTFYTIQPGTTVALPEEIATELVERGFAEAVPEEE